MRLKRMRMKIAQSAFDVLDHFPARNARLDDAVCTFVEVAAVSDDL